jgi:hypothetical protein
VQNCAALLKRAIPGTCPDQILNRLHAGLQPLSGFGMYFPLDKYSTSGILEKILIDLFKFGFADPVLGLPKLSSGKVKISRVLPFLSTCPLARKGVSPAVLYGARQ